MVHHRVPVLVPTPCKEVHVPAMVLRSALHTHCPLPEELFFFGLQRKVFTTLNPALTQFLQHTWAGASLTRNQAISVNSHTNVNMHVYYKVWSLYIFILASSKPAISPFVLEVHAEKILHVDLSHIIHNKSEGMLRNTFKQICTNYISWSHT